MTPTATGIESDPMGRGTAGEPRPAGRLDVPLHTRLTAVRFRDQTDRANALVHAETRLLHPSDRLALRGNLFVIEPTGSGAGWVAVKAGPLPERRASPSEHDLRAEPTAEGFALELQADDGYAWRVEPFEGGWLGRKRALDAVQTPAAGRLDRRFVSNTWGDRSRDGRLSAAFVRAEIDAAADLGVDVLQLDDGWQRGTSSNSVDAQAAGGVWQGFYDSDPTFWTPHPERFPDGLGPLTAHAARRGIELGLWFAPDSSDDFANWRRDVETVQAISREHGVRHFKFDSIDTPSPEAEANLHRFFDALLGALGDRVVVDLDITAGTRPGYFGRMDCGPLFVANRYTDWHNYWSHHTFRVLWELAHWVPAERLRVELLNPRRNPQLYPDDPLAPGRTPIDVALAPLLVAQPLGWFEASNLHPDDVASARSLVDVWRTHRDGLADHTVVPIGDPPDGHATSGFLTIDPEGTARYLIVIAGLSSPQPVMLPETMSVGGVERLAGHGEIEARSSRINYRAPSRPSFWFGRVDR